MTRSPTLYNVAVRTAYGTQWWGPYLSLAKAQARVKDEMSPNRDGERSAALFRDGTEAPIAEYELVPRMVLRTRKGTGRWTEKVVATRVENPTRRAKPRRRKPR